MFRVGQADENLPTSGVTHLIEHLAFPHDHRDGVANNGTTRLLTTEFFAWGDPRDAAEFLHRVTRGISRLAVDRIDQQRSIIATQERRWAITPRGELQICRGAHGPGVVGFRGLGLRQLDAATIEAYRALRDDPRLAIGWMHQAAERYLNGWRSRSSEEELEEELEVRRSQTRTTIGDAWREAMPEAALCVPSTVVVNDPRFHRPDWPLPLKGREFPVPGLRLTKGARAVPSDEGLSLFDKEGHHVGMRFGSTAALVHGEGPARMLIADDGSELFVDAAWYASGADLIAELDRAIPVERHIRRMAG